MAENANEKTWLQPVRYRSARLGVPRPVHLRRVLCEQDGMTETGKPRFLAKSVAPSGLCGVRPVTPAPPGARANCAQCLRIAARWEG